MKYLTLLEALGVTPYPAQRVLCAVAFDGVEPRDLEGDDRDLAVDLFGEVDVIPPDARNVLCCIAGARSGKSYLLGALRMLHLALTVPLDTLAAGEAASAIIVAPDLRLARQELRFVGGAMAELPAVAANVVSQTEDSITIQRESAVTIECLPATRGGSAVRGRSLVGAVMSEGAFFRDSNAVINDSEVFRALAPRIMVGGQLVIASTPWAEAGLLFDLFTLNHEHPSTAIAAHAPTLLLRPEPRLAAVIEAERARDPENAAREFDAEFMAAGSDLFFDPAMVDAAFREAAQ